MKYHLCYGVRLRVAHVKVNSIHMDGLFASGSKNVGCQRVKYSISLQTFHDLADMKSRSAVFTSFPFCQLRPTLSRSCISVSSTGHTGWSRQSRADLAELVCRAGLKPTDQDPTITTQVLIPVPPSAYRPHHTGHAGLVPV